MEPSEPRTIYQHYEVERRPDGSLHELGRGAMGITYKALDSNLRVPVALKVITGVLLPDARARSRFLREARAAAQLRHNNVATVYHLGQEEDFCFYTMEFVEGETLEARVRRDGPMDALTALQVCQQVARALQAAHSRGLLHRDLKPSNLMVAAEGEDLLVKVIDFGLVKPLQPDDADASSASLSGGLFLGTPLYASPEQCASEETIDGRADLYSLGATLWFMLTGGPPFRGSVRTVMAQHLTKPPPLESLRGQPAAVSALLCSLLAKEPSDRPADAAALRVRIAEALRGWEAKPGPPIVPEPPPATALVCTLDDVLRQRGALLPEEVGFLLPRLVASAEPTAAGQSVTDLSPRNVRVRFAAGNPTAGTGSLLATSPRGWPPFTLETTPTPPSASTRADLGGTLLDPPENAPGTPVESLALLTYELLGGSPLPVGRGYRPLAALDESANSVLRAALPLGEPPVYVGSQDFCAAFLRALEGGSVHKAALTPAPGAHASGPSSPTRDTSVPAAVSAGAKEPPEIPLPLDGGRSAMPPVRKRLSIVSILLALLLAAVLVSRQKDKPGTKDAPRQTVIPPPSPPPSVAPAPPAPPAPVAQPSFVPVPTPPAGSPPSAASPLPVERIKPEPPAASFPPLTPGPQQTARRRQPPSPAPPPEPARTAKKPVIASPSPSRAAREKSSMRDIQRQAIEKQHRNGQLTDSEYREALQGLNH